MPTIEEVTKRSKQITDKENGNVLTHSETEKVKKRRYRVKTTRFVKVVQTGNVILDYIIHNMTYGLEGQSVKLPSDIMTTLATDNGVSIKTVRNTLKDLERRNIIFRYAPRKWDVIIVNPHFFRMGSDNDLIDLESCITIDTASRSYTFHKDMWDAKFKPFLVGDAFEIGEKNRLKREAKKDAEMCKESVNK